MGCGLSRHRGALAGARRRGSLGFFEKHVGVGLQTEVALLAGWFAGGSPGRGGRLDPAGLAASFGLPPGPALERLHELFDRDADGGVGFREFVYGLSKFHSKDSEARVEFAFRLFDRDGDGELDRGELEVALQLVCAAETLQWTAPLCREGARTGRPGARAPRRGGRGGEGRLPPAPDRQKLRSSMEKALETSVGDALRYSDFRALAARWPVLTASASCLYESLRPFSSPARCLVMALPKSIHVALLNGLGLQPYAKSRSTKGLQPPCGATPLQLPRSASKAGGPFTPPVQGVSPQATSPALNVGGASGWLDVRDSFDTLPGAVPARGTGQTASRAGETGMLLSELMNASWTSYSQRQPGSPKLPQVCASRKYGPRGRSSSEPTHSSEVAIFLRALGLTQCQSAFELAGLYTVESLRFMSEPELRSIGVPAAAATALRGALGRGTGQVERKTRPSSDGALRSCRICMEAEVQVCTKPCGHAIMCEECAQRITRISGECPLCRAQISECIRLYTA